MDLFVETKQIFSSETAGQSLDICCVENVQLTSNHGPERSNKPAQDVTWFYIEFKGEKSSCQNHNVLKLDIL